MFRTHKGEKKSFLWHLSIYSNALNRSNNRDCSQRAHLFLNYHLIYVLCSYILHRKMQQSRDVRDPRKNYLLGISYYAGLRIRLEFARIHMAPPKKNWVRFRSLREKKPRSEILVKKQDPIKIFDKQNRFRIRNFKKWIRIRNPCYMITIRSKIL